MKAKCISCRGARRDFKLLNMRATFVHHFSFSFLAIYFRKKFLFAALHFCKKHLLFDAVWNGIGGESKCLICLLLEHIIALSDFEPSHNGKELIDTPISLWNDRPTDGPIPIEEDYNENIRKCKFASSESVRFIYVWRRNGSIRDESRTQFFSHTINVVS